MIGDVLEKIRNFDGAEVGNGTDEEEIADAENALANPFPSDYREFLKSFGWASFGQWAVYGLGAGVPKYLHLVAMTLSERTEMFPPLPDHLVSILNNGAGDLHCLDTSRINDGHCPIVIWYHEDGVDQVPYSVAESFELWLADMVQTA